MPSLNKQQKNPFLLTRADKTPEVRAAAQCVTLLCCTRYFNSPRGICQAVFRIIL